MILDATPLVRAYARLRLARLAALDAVATQERLLRDLVARAANTRFHRDHGLERVHSVGDFQRAVPLRTYDAFWKQYWGAGFPVLENVTWPGRIPLFANSSGTSSGATKHIPVSREMAAANRRAAIDVLIHHVANRPASRILGGRNFFLGGSTALQCLAPSVAAGDLSGIAAAQVPWWARPYYFPTGALAQISDWEEKTNRLARESIRQDVRSIAGGPSWLLLFFEQLAALSPGKGRELANHFPNLEMIVHGGMAFAPYKRHFDHLLVGSHAETREVYPASEGFIAVADRGPREGMRLLTDNGLFFEFVPLEELDASEPIRHWLGNAETDVNYALVLTTCAGLWSYVTGDTVRLVGLDPPRLQITGRISYSLSAFGEHLIGEDVEQAVSEAADLVAGTIADFSVGTIHDRGGSGRGHHLYVVEFTAPMRMENARLFTDAIDQALCRLNEDYAVHRRGDFSLRPPQVMLVRQGTFAEWMKSRGKLGGQNKVPRLVADSQAFAAFAQWASARGTIAAPPA